MKQLLTTLVILTGFLRSAGAVWADAKSDFDKGLAAYKAGKHTEAVKWFRKAAEQGHAESQYGLGLMYYLGEGVLQDTIAAHMWFNIAAANGDKASAKNRNIVAKELSSEQL